MKKQPNTYTLEQIKERCSDYKIKEGNKKGEPAFNYSKNTDVNYTDNSKLTLICNLCGDIFHVTVKMHFEKQGNGHGNNHPWTVQKIKNLVKLEFIGKFEYIISKPMITKEYKKSKVDKKNKKDKKFDKDSSMYMICSDCHCETKIGVYNHVRQGYGCAVCLNTQITEYNLGIFLYLANKEHPGKFDYSRVTMSHFIENGVYKGVYSRVPITCKICPAKWVWNPTISAHLNDGDGCPFCGGKVKYNAEILRIKTLHVHGHLYDVSHVTDDDVKKDGYMTKITPFCNVCNKMFDSEVAINDFINHESGCRVCSNRVPYNLERLIMKSREIHGEGMYDFSNLKEEDIVNNKKIIEFICLRCKNSVDTTIGHHINAKRGCLICNEAGSKLEQDLAKILKENNIEFTREFRIKSLPSRRFDFKFRYKNYDIILEADGMQHHKLSRLFHDDDLEVFKRQQEIDVIKTYNAITEGYIVIRIDYTYFRSVTALKKRLFELLSYIDDDTSCVFSDKFLYEYISSGLNKYADWNTYYNN